MYILFNNENGSLCQLLPEFKIPAGILTGIPTGILTGVPVRILTEFQVGILTGIPDETLIGISEGIVTWIPVEILTGTPDRDFNENPDKHSRRILTGIPGLS